MKPILFWALLIGIVSVGCSDNKTSGENFEGSDVGGDSIEVDQKHPLQIDPFIGFSMISLGSGIGELDLKMETKMEVVSQFGEPTDIRKNTTGIVDDVFRFEFPGDTIYEYRYKTAQILIGFEGERLTRVLKFWSSY